MSESTTAPDGAELAAALLREHQAIDAGVEAYVAGLDGDHADPAPLLEAMTALRRHIYLEEELLFPPIHQAGLVMPILVMLREHGELWRVMDELDSLVETGDPDRLRSVCAELLGLLEAHNSKEEPIVYPHTATDLSAEATAELGRFLETGRTPEGWTCRDAPLAG